MYRTPVKKVNVPGHGQWLFVSNVSSRHTRRLYFERAEVDFLISKIEYGEYRDKLVDKRDKIRVRASLFIELKKKNWRALESGRLPKGPTYDKFNRVSFFLFFFSKRSPHASLDI